MFTREVNSTGFALEEVSDDLKHDSDVVTAAVSQKGESLEFACEQFRGSKTIVMSAVKQ